MRRCIVLLVMSTVAAAGCHKAGAAGGPETIQTEVSAEGEPHGTIESTEVTEYDACAAYAACCDAYVAALEKAGGVPAETLASIEEGCAEGGADGEGGSDALCDASMGSLRPAVESWEDSLPGFTVPEECE